MPHQNISNALNAAAVRAAVANVVDPAELFGIIYVAEACD
jgi:hypothetical protein